MRRNLQRIAGLILTIVISAPGVAQHAIGFGQGTAEVVVITPHKLIVAGDSREVYREDHDGVQTVTQSTACKGRNVGPFYVFVAGMVRSAAGFSALDEIADDYRQGASIEDFASSVGLHLTSRLQFELASLSKFSEGLLTKQFEGKSTLEVLIAGMDRGRPRALTIDFKWLPSPGRADPVVASLASCPGSCGHSTYVIELGVHRSMDRYLAAHPFALVRPDLNLVRRLMDLEYRDSSEIVGGPLTIVEITKDASKVIEYGVCFSR